MLFCFLSCVLGVSLKKSNKKGTLVKFTNVPKMYNNPLYIHIICISASHSVFSKSACDLNVTLVLCRHSEARLESGAFTAYHTAPTPVETSTPPNREYIGKEPIRYIDIVLWIKQKVKRQPLKNL